MFSLSFYKIIQEYKQVQFIVTNFSIGQSINLIEGMHFFLGIEVDAIEEVSPELVFKIIPKGKYLKFIHSGLSKNVGFTYRYIYDQFLPDTNHQLSKPFNFEYYGDNYESAESEKSESYIFIPIK